MGCFRTCKDVVCSALATALFAMLCVTCVAQAKPPPRQFKNDPSHKISFVIKTDKSSYRSGEPVQIELTVTNPTKSPFVMNFATGQHFDAIILKATEAAGTKQQTVWWTWSKGRMFTENINSVTISPGKSLSYKVRLSKDEPASPAQLGAGAYTVVGKITVLGQSPLPTATSTITVK